MTPWGYHGRGGGWNRPTSASRDLPPSLYHTASRRVLLDFLPKRWARQCTPSESRSARRGVEAEGGRAAPVIVWRATPFLELATCPGFPIDHAWLDPGDPAVSAGRTRGGAGCLVSAGACDLTSPADRRCAGGGGAGADRPVGALDRPAAGADRRGIVDATPGGPGGGGLGPRGRGDVEPRGD